MDLLILVPAAGRSTRMGRRDKLLEDVGGEALLRRQVRAGLGAGAPVLVSLPKGGAGPRAEVLAELSGLGFAFVRAEEGLAASLRAGAEAAGQHGAAGLMVLLPDLPEIEAGDVAACATAFAADPTACLRATAEDGTPGHPVIFPARLFPALARLTGDTGGREILGAEHVRPLPLQGRRAVTDLDTPEDWAAWRARTGL